VSVVYDDESVRESLLYEMTRYGALIAWAKQLGRNDCASVLQRTWMSKGR
jgi:ferritin-like metal-binding protein YciE